MKKIVEKIIGRSKDVFQSGALISLEPIDILYITTTFEGYPQQENGGHLEELDLENFGILEVTDTKLRFWAGGDWQTPMEVTLELINDEFIFTKVQKGEDELFFDRIHSTTLEEEVVYNLFGLEML